MLFSVDKCRPFQQPHLSEPCATLATAMRLFAELVDVPGVVGERVELFADGTRMLRAHWKGDAWMIEQSRLR